MQAKVFNSIIEAIGNTPIVRLNQVAAGLQANLYAKLEFTNPGGSIKDRIGWWLIADAEKRGALKPGGTIIEGTSGNTGVGLAMAATIKGYKCIFVLPDKMSEEKIKNLRAYGARVIVTPTAVLPDDHRSYYSVAKRLATETPDSLYIDQYNNLANREYHCKYTAPEILRQMPDLDVIIAGIGTGGTITGIGQFMKAHKPDIEIIAVDPIGSIVYETFKYGNAKNPAEGYLIEGIGEDFIPANYDLTVIDDMVQVADKESFVMTRELLTKEGIYAGVSSGSAFVGAKRWVQQQGARLKGKNVLIIFPDSGNRYTSKVYDDDWMREAGFLESDHGVVDDLLKKLGKGHDEIFTAAESDQVASVITKLSAAGVSQLPVKDENGWVKGIIRESVILKSLFNNQIGVGDPIGGLVETSIEFITAADSIDRVSRLVTDGKVPLVTDPENGDNIIAIITNIDLLNFLGSR